MPPKSAPVDGFPVHEKELYSHGSQALYIIRHGDRWDYENPEWKKVTERPGDPPLSYLGHRQARETGAFLDRILSDDGVTAESITWLSSPFLRTLQTSNEALGQFNTVLNARSVKILLESSVFEWDGKNGEWHSSLPDLRERVHYFPRVDLTHQSLFIPTIPEPRSVFHARCDRVMALLDERYPFRPNTAIVIVTHAAACISLVRAATGCSLDDVTPAAPCSIYKLTRQMNRNGSMRWTIDPHDAPNGMNGHTAHLSSLGTATVPWNHFGDKRINQGYTGPLTSCFAPPSIRNEQ